MKTNFLQKILALILLVSGLGVVQEVLGAATIYEAVGIYGTSYTANNTWTKTGTAATGSECETTALDDKVTITLSKGFIGSNAMTVFGTGNLKIQAATGCKVYRVVFSPDNSNPKPNDAVNYLTSNGSGSITNNTWNSGTDAGNNSVTFNGVDADQSFKIVHINVYIKYEATAAQASISPSSISLAAQDADVFTFRLTTNLGYSFAGANSPYQNQVETDASADDVEVCTSYENKNCYQYLSGTYSNNSNISFGVYAYNEGTYNADIFLGWQTGNNSNHDYHMLSLELPFTIEVTDACTKNTTLTFATAGPINKTITSAAFTNAATIKYNNVATNTGQTITYTSSDEEVATVSSTGQVTIVGIGTTTIKAKTLSEGDYCGAEATYTLNVTGFTVTLHYPACAAAVGGGVLTGTSHTFTDQGGAFGLNYDMSVEGYAFKGWSPNSSNLSTRYTDSYNVTANVDLYAVYGEVSNDFQVNTNGTPMSAGDYVITGAYNGTYAPVMTTTYNNGKLSANTDEYSVTSSGKLQCKEETCIWAVAAVSGGFTIQNSSTGKYLSATSGDKSNSDLKLRLVDSPDAYSVWSFTSSSNNRYEVLNNKRNTDSDSGTKLMCNGNYFGFYTSNCIAPAFFKRTASSSTLTTNPSCNLDEVIVTIQNQTEGTAVASGTGGACVWDSPVLSKLYGGETITLTATPETGYQFTSWTVVSGGVSLSASNSANPATFTMPTNNVVIRPNFTPATYQITYKDNGNTAFSGSPASPTPATYTFGTGATLPEVTKTGYVFMGWFAESDCSGTRVNSISTTDFGDKTFYALFMQLADYRAWCPEPTVSLTGDNVFVTSTQGKTIMAAAQLTLNGSNLVPGSTVQLTTPSGSGLSFSTERVKSNATSAALDVTAGLDGNIDDQLIYVHYTPTVAGTTAVPEDILVTATYQTNTAYYSTQNVHVRNLPANFAIAIKQGGNWYALPADIASASQPAGVLIDVDETTWTCKGPETLNYTLWPVKSTTGTADCYSVRGEKLRFTGNSNKALYGSTATTTINNESTIAEANADVTTNTKGSYEWAVTTAVDGTTWKYTLDASTDKFLRYYNATSWGTYASGVNEVYLIPIVNVTEANLSVMEWGETSVALKCAANTTLTGVKVNGVTVASPTLTSLGGDIYSLSGLPNLSTLETYAMKKMVIEVSEGGTPKQATLIIPFILTSTNSPASAPKTAIELRNLAEGSSQEARNLITSVVDVVIRGGAQLDVTKATGNAMACDFKDMYIYPGAKLNVATNDINAENIYLRGGYSWLDQKATFLLPQMKVADGNSIIGIGPAGHGVYYDFYADFAMYYMLALPKDVNTGLLTNEENGDDWYANIKYYDGSERVLDPKGNKSWKWVTGGTLSRGIGYEIAVKPRNGRNIGILRFPLLTGAWANETDAAPSVTAHGKTGYEATPPTVTANNVGWNLMGNPFFSAFTNNGANMYIYELVPHLNDQGQWTGTYDFNTAAGHGLKYFTIPNKTDYDYTDERATDYKLEAFWPFFIQANATGTLSFDAANRVLRKPYLSNEVAREVAIDINLFGNNTEDKAGLNISDNYSDNFDMDDKEKTINNGTQFMKVYTVMDGYRIAFNSLTEATAATLVPVGYIAPAAGTYTFSLPQQTDLSQVEYIWLTDYTTGDVTNLIFDDYKFETVAGQNDERFALTVVLKAPHVATDIDGSLADGTSNLDAVKVSSADGKIIMRGLPEGASMWLYDATGKLYNSQTNINGGRAELKVSVAGAYNVRISAGSESVTIKTVVR